MKADFLIRISAALYIFATAWSASSIVFFLTWAFAMQSSIAALLVVGWACCTGILAMGINDAVLLVRGL